ncbi:pyruvate dehydrogenase E2 component (dihydrolipoamide acetyltransferase) [Planomicrobium sp. HSC-17F08]|nr:pyruvate dehydrogenase E2 component (dihydrolipoamide acetyltransferase) [Planomicrobium sp. HSC-17F08]
MSNYHFALPDIGEGLHEAEIVTWLVKPGDRVEENDNIVEVQTDKAVVEISAPVTGEIEALGGEEGATVKVGDTLVVFSGVPSERAHGKTAEAVELPTPPETIAEKETKTAHRVLAAPSVRKAARVAGVDLADVVPTGKGGKILTADLQRHLETSGQAPEQPQPVLQETVSPASSQARTEKITGTRKAIFEKMTAAKQHAVMCTGMDEINVTKLVDLRKTLMPHAEEHQTKLTYLPFIIKAAAHVLKRYPLFNASVDEANMEIRYHEEVHIGVATATDNGLLVPVIKHADQKSVLELAKELEELSQKARDRKLKSHELTGSTFTVSSTGGGGGFYATPILNHPEVAIMGVHKISKQAIVVDDEIQIGHMMGMSLTFDHRIIDGEPSGQFMNGVKKLLETPELLILEGK